MITGAAVVVVGASVVVVVGASVVVVVGATVVVVVGAAVVVVAAVVAVVVVDATDDDAFTEADEPLLPHALSVSATMAMASGSIRGALRRKDTRLDEEIMARRL
jgi:hypothetical protein